MATILKRGNSYRITTSVGYARGEQKRFNKTWKPSSDMTEKQIKKELARVVALFEDECGGNSEFDHRITFREFSGVWLKDHAEKTLKVNTIQGYKTILPRIMDALGDIKLMDLKPRHLIEFMNNLDEANIRIDKKYICNIDINSEIQKLNLSLRQFAENIGISTATLYQVRTKSPISEVTMLKICNALSLDPSQAFNPKTDHTIARQTQLHHFRLISSILTMAVYWQVIPYNPCRRVKPPKVERKEARYLEHDEAKRLLHYLEKEDLQFRTLITLLLYTGMRRGEVCGLKWDDICMEDKYLRVKRALSYTPETGIVFDTPKTKSSMRVIGLPTVMIELLREYKIWQDECREKLGDKWGDHNLVFTKWNGEPELPVRATSRFRAFIGKTDLPQISLHTLRHTNATILIAASIDPKTVSARLGHARLSTTMDIYTHVIASANEKAADTLEGILNESA